MFVKCIVPSPKNLTLQQIKRLSDAEPFVEPFVEPFLCGSNYTTSKIYAGVTFVLKGDTCVFTVLDV